MLDHAEPLPELVVFKNYYCYYIITAVAPEVRLSPMLSPSWLQTGMGMVVCSHPSLLPLPKHLWLPWP